MKFTYEHDQKNGPYEEYEENGKLVKKGAYVNGKFAPEKKGLFKLKAKLTEAQMKPSDTKLSLIGKCFKMFRGNGGR